MSAKKPLIFIHPLSESLQKLKEVIEEIAEDELIEIYELENQAEINQLLPTIGQSLSIFSNAKKCALTLQPNRKVVQKLNSKVLLLSKKSLPRRTLDKFSKIGLTECIVEPVQPKTLLYKVKLLLRSIVVQAGQEEEEDYDKKFGGDEEESASTNEKQRLEKGILQEDDLNIDMNLKGKVNNALEIDADEIENKEKSYKEDAINKEWRGSVNETSLSFDEDSEEDKQRDDANENYIDSYLRSKKTNTAEISFDDDSQKKESGEDSYDDFDDDIYKKKKKDISLDFEADQRSHDEDSDRDHLDNDDKYYKSKSSEKTLDLQVDKEQEYEFQDEMQDEINQARRKSEFNLDLSADEEESELSPDLEEDIYGKKSTQEEMHLDLSADEESSALDEDEPDDQKKKKSASSVTLELGTDDEHNRDSSKKELEFDKEDEEDQDDEEHEKISSHWKGDIAASIELEAEEEIDARDKKENELELDKDNKNNGQEHEGLDLEADDDQNQSKSHDELELEKEKSDQDESPYGVDIEADEELYGRKKDTQLKFDEDSDHEEQDLDEKSAHDKSGKKKEDKSLDLDFGEDDQDYHDEDEDDHLGDYKRRQAGVNLDLDDGDTNNKHSAHTEHIQTNMDSRKGIKHQEYDWDIKHDKKSALDQEEQGKNKGEMEISFAQKVDLGEQTIDYRKLKSEFDAITINRVGNKKKRSGPTYVSDESAKDFLKGVYDGELEEGLEEISNLARVQDNDKNDQYFEPNPNGIDSAVRVLNLYQDKFLKKENIFKFVANELRSKFRASTFIFSYSREEKIYKITFDHTQDEFYPSDYIKNFWNDFMQENINFWADHNLPHWHDENFSTSENQFFYPLTEGNTKFGFVICVFENQVAQSKTQAIEVIVETIRGIVLEEYREMGVKGEYHSSANSSKKEEESVGFMKKVFSLFKRAS